MSMVMIGIIAYLLAMGLVLLILLIKNRRMIKNSSSGILPNMNGIVRNGNIREKQTGKNHLYVLYKFYRTLPFVKKIFNKVYKQIETVYPADIVSVNEKATRIMTKNILKGLFVIVFSLVFAGGNLFFILFGIATAYILFYSGIQNGVEKMEETLLKQFENVLPKIRRYYHKSEIIEDAIFSVLDECEYEISLHLARIYEILNSVDMEQKASAYIDVAPDNFILTFVSICTAVKEHGDKKIGKTSAFKMNLKELRNEIKQELLSRYEKMLMFKTKVGLTVFPLFAMKGLEWWSKSFFPDTASYFDSSLGLGMMIGVFASVLIAYTLVMDLKSNQAREEKMNSLFMRLSNIEPFSTLLTKEINAHYTKYMRINDRMKAVGDKTGPKTFLFKSVFFSVITFVTLNLLLFTGILAQKDNLINNFSEAFEEVATPNETYIEQMESAGAVAANTWKEYDITEENKAEYKEKITQDVKADLHLKGSGYAEEVADKVVEQILEAKNTYFKWYYLIISLVFAFFAYHIPEFYLRFRTKINSMSQEDEVNQYNTLMFILMNVDGITMNEILEQIERFARSFRESIQECIINLEFGEQEALENLKDSESNPEFKNFCENLLSCDDIGVQAAFEEIMSDRENYLAERKLKQSETNIRKAKMAGRISFVPMGITILGYLLIPLTIYGMKMFATFSQNMM